MTIFISAFNETYIKIDSDDVGILFELSEHFTFDVPGARYMPLFKMKVWDGKVRIFNLNKKLLYHGLTNKVIEFAKTRGYDYELVPSAAYGIPGQTTNFLPEDAKGFVDALDIHSKGNKLEVRDYQYYAFHQTVKFQRRTILSPTASGKSLIQYCLARYFSDQDMRMLIIVPTISLVHQMKGDFVDYSSANGWDTENNTHMIMSGREKHSNKNVVFSTWQSVYKMPHSFFNAFDCICIDEVHLAAAKSLTSIMESATDVKYRFGLTGSLDNSKTNHTIIQGLFGEIIKMTTTKKLIDEGHLADIHIKCLVLKYNNESKSLVRHMDYQKEIDFIVGHERRNKFIRNLALSLEGNTLILYTYIDKHGSILHEMIKDKCHEDRKLFYIHGGVVADEREQVRHITEESNNAIILASSGTFATGVNIKRLHNIIFASPSKSVIRILQSLGRGLRKGHDKNHVVVYDISDEIVKSKSKANFTYNHFRDRLAIYTKEEFPYSIVEVPIE